MPFSEAADNPKISQPDPGPGGPTCWWAWRRAYGLLAVVEVSMEEADGQLSSVGCQDWSGL